MPRNLAADILTFGIGRGPLSRTDFMRWYALPAAEQNRRNREHLDQHVVTWDKALAKARAGKGASRRLIFLHIPKAGGSTLDNIIAKNYGVNSVIHINYPSIVKNPKALFKDGFLPSVVLGHFKLNQIIYQCPSRSFAHITMLRDPVSRLISYYNFLLAAPGHRRAKHAATMSFEDFALSKNVYECHNEQALRLAGMLSRKTARKDDLCKRALELAKENLQSRFTLFGPLERYTEFLIMARKMLRWRDPFHTKRKVTRDTDKRVRLSDLSETAIDRIRERNRYDLELCEWADDIFQQRIDELGITQRDIEEFDRQNHEYQQLVTLPTNTASSEDNS